MLHYFKTRLAAIAKSIRRAKLQNRQVIRTTSARWRTHGQRRLCSVRSAAEAVSISVFKLGRILNMANDSLRACLGRLHAVLRAPSALLGPPYCPPRKGETLGARGERVATQYLRRRGLQIVGQGVRDSLGELDIVAIDRRTVVYVEVKTRRSDAHDRPADAVDRHKRFRISRAAAAFAKRNNVEGCRTRFDIIEVVWPDDNLPPRINHISSAFESELD